MTLPGHFYWMLTAITLLGGRDSQSHKPQIFYMLGDWGCRGELNQLAHA